MAVSNSDQSTLRYPRPGRRSVPNYRLATGICGAASSALGLREPLAQLAPGRARVIRRGLSLAREPPPPCQRGEQRGAAGRQGQAVLSTSEQLAFSPLVLRFEA